MSWYFVCMNHSVQPPPPPPVLFSSRTARQFQSISHGTETPSDCGCQRRFFVYSTARAWRTRGALFIPSRFSRARLIACAVHVTPPSLPSPVSSLCVSCVSFFTTRHRVLQNIFGYDNDKQLWRRNSWTLTVCPGTKRPTPPSSRRRPSRSCTASCSATSGTAPASSSSGCSSCLRTLASPAGGTWASLWEGCEFLLPLECTASRQHVLRSAPYHKLFYFHVDEMPGTNCCCCCSSSRDETKQTKRNETKRNNGLHFFRTLYRRCGCLSLLNSFGLSYCIM